MRLPKTFREVINLWPSRAHFARDIGVEYVTAQMMDRRNSINAEYFDAIAEAAKKIKCPKVNHRLLSQLAAQRKQGVVDRRKKGAAA